MALGSVATPILDYPVFCLKHLVKNYTLDECDKKLKGLFVSKLYFMSQQKWIDLELGNHKSGAGFEMLPKEQITAALPSIVTDDVSKLHVIRFNGKTGRIIGLKSRDIFHITHIEVNKNKPAYNHGS